MKRSAFLTFLILTMLPLIALPLLDRGRYVAGRIRIPVADISAEVLTASCGSDCGCCGVLWQGGVVTTTSDLSAVQIDDTAYLTTVDGERSVLECVEITPCLRVGNTLIGWRGILQSDGDVLIVSGSRVYRWARL